ncbi:MAG: nucleotide exchange factor GrpE, partial [Chloroflexia bacterium]|nr:nucleotide exchange factor GrpE [Chloroflexia bacterium]
MNRRIDPRMAQQIRLAEARQRMSARRGVGSEPVFDVENLRDESDPDMAGHPEPSGGDGLALEAIVVERDRYLDQLQRTAADFANYRRRTEQERAQQRLLANEQLLREIVPVLDDLQRGLGALPPDERDSALAEGMRWVEQKFLTTLKKHGVTQIDSLGQRFDPSMHEAVEADPAGGDRVVAVYAPGYRLGEDVLRPAMV